jgi:ZIP family zinc transporter
MLEAGFTSLIPPGVEGWGFWRVGLGILGGVALIRLLDLFTPHISCAGTRGFQSWRIR